MKSNVWLLCVALLSAGFIGCSKKQALSPEDTALLKGGNRGTFVNGDGTSGEEEDLLSPVGATITGLTGDGLAPQDPFWGDNLANGERPFEPIFFDSTNTMSEQKSVQNFRMWLLTSTPIQMPVSLLKDTATGKVPPLTTNLWETVGHQVSNNTSSISEQTATGLISSPWEMSLPLPMQTPPHPPWNARLTLWC